MQPFSRETIIDRRQPVVRWSAVVAGAATAVGTWILLQLFGMGIALLLLDAEELDNLRAVGVGTTIWSVVAPVLALFVGGYLASRLAGHHDRKVSGVHGLLVWALVAVIGLFAVLETVDRMNPRATAADGGVHRGLSGLVDRALERANAQLRVEDKEELEREDFIAAAREAAALEGYDQRRFTLALAEEAELERADAERVVRGLGDQAPDVVEAASAIGEVQAEGVREARRSGMGFLAAAVALLLGLAAAVAGALLAAGQLVQRRRGGGEVLDEDRPHTTAPYPAPPVAPAPSDYDEPR